MSGIARLLGRLLVGMLTPVLLAVGPAALAGGPIHDPNDGASQPRPRPWPDIFGRDGRADGLRLDRAEWGRRLLAVAVLVWLFALARRRHVEEPCLTEMSAANKGDGRG